MQGEAQRPSIMPKSRCHGRGRRKVVTHMMPRLVLAFGLGFCLIAPRSLTFASASDRGGSASQPETRAASTSISYGNFPDSPFGHFLYYLGQGRTEEAQAAFSQLSTFEERYRALTQAVYPAQYPPGTREVVTSCAGTVLKGGTNPHRRAAIYRVLAKMSYRLKDGDAALEHAQKAVQLNPNSPWGWFWLAEVYWYRGLYASEAAARRHELSLFTGSTTDDAFHRASICGKLGLLYVHHFGEPETAIRYFHREIAETMKLPADENYGAYRISRCSGSFMNILSIEAQALHDLPRAQQTLEQAAAMIPSFPGQPLDRDGILRLGLRLPTAGAPSR